MIIRTVAHKGLKRLITHDDPSKVPALFSTKLKNVIGFLVACENVEELSAFPLWNIHQLKGDRYPSWSISISRNFRLTFIVNDLNEIENLDYEDYH